MHVIKRLLCILTCLLCFTNLCLSLSGGPLVTLQYLLQTKLKEKALASEKRKALLRTGSLKNDEFDYQEVPEISSSISTPSNSYWDSPFAQDSLGETVIHLDKVSITLPSNCISSTCDLQ